MTHKIKKVLVGIAALVALALGGSALAGAAPGGGKATPAQERSQAADGSEQNEATEAEGKEEAESGAADSDNVQDENGKDDGSEASEKGAKEDASDKPVTGSAASRAKKAALDEVGGGNPGHVERDNEKGATYEVEVTKANGKKVDVRLDDRFKVVAVDEDNERDQAGEQDQAGEDGAGTP